MITGQTQLAGVIGSPVSHSKSPLLHNYWLNQRQIDGVYIPLPCAPENLAQVVFGLKALNFKGWNVTLPYKQAIVDHLDALTPAAEQIQAVNTVYRDQQGRYVGDNTDAFGFLENLCAQADKASFTKADAMILGAGGAARAILFALIPLGFNRIWVANRSYEKAEQLTKDFLQFSSGQVELSPLALKQSSQQLSSCSLFVNTTTLGMQSQAKLTLDLSALPSDAVISDIVYTPLETDLLAWGRARGNCCVEGLGMLLHQARPGFARWFDAELPAIDQALYDYILAA